MPVADLFPPSLTFSHLWPWIGLVLAVPLAIALAGGGLRGDRSVTRWRDPVWLCWAGTLAYLFHQVEEHGVDALVLESLLAFKRAGCSGMLTYHALDAARLLNS